MSVLQSATCITQQRYKINQSDKLFCKKNEGIFRLYKRFSPFALTTTHKGGEMPLKRKTPKNNLLIKIG